MASPILVTIRCGQRMTTGLKCKCPRVRGKTLCARHLTVERKRARRVLVDAVWMDALDLLWGGWGAPQEWHATVAARLDAIEATPAEREQFQRIMIEEVDVYLNVHPAVGAGAGAPRTELEALGRDAQNVHTPAVTTQTTAGVAVLADTPGAVGQKTVAEMKAAWSAYPSAQRTSILKDVTRWYTTETCRTEGDGLYRRMLDGLWARIKLAPHKDDLIQRLWEEAVESRGTCCEGHISRLCNVLVGYDETFTSPISAGELLQQRIAAIAAEDISLAHKVVKAWEVMEELQVPREQRMEWVEAF